MSPSTQEVPNGLTTATSYGSKEVKVIGVYGIPGSGKTTVMTQLKHDLDAERFSFYEGSEVIAELTPGGLAAFQKLDEPGKLHLRQRAIRKIHDDCRESRKTAIVTGHFMFWREHDELGEVVCTETDLATYTHIIYMAVPPNVIEQRCTNDAVRQRYPFSVDQLSKWQQAELAALEPLCRENNILLSVVDAYENSSKIVESLVLDFAIHDEMYNNSCAEYKLDQAVSSQLSQADTVMVIDGDRTLTPDDTGMLFWKKALAIKGGDEAKSPLKELFSGPLGYSYAAFRQATLLHEQIADDDVYENICQQVASATRIHPEFLSLLQLVKELAPVSAIIVSCGLRRIWEIVLERAGLQGTVGVIAGGRIADGMVVTAAVKATIVARLQNYHQKRVWAFGDSPLDLQMLQMADQAVVVVIDQDARSRSMEAALSNAIDQEGLQALQVVLPSSSTPRLDSTKLPILDITKVDFVNALLEYITQPTGLHISIANDAASKLLAIPMRDAAIHGPGLRKAHKKAGLYLAQEHLSRIIGLEDCPINHVLGCPANGSRLSRESQTTIVSLMRGGDPMASGVSEAFPRVMYVHVKVPEDLKAHHLEGQAQVILVDSVVNTGKSVIECAQAIHHLNPNIRIIIVAGVIQAQCLDRRSDMHKALSALGRVDVVALRVSDTKFTGSGTTDTGNRLFNTTHLS